MSCKQARNSFPTVRRIPDRIVTEGTAVRQAKIKLGLACNRTRIKLYLIYELIYSVIHICHVPSEICSADVD